MQSPIELLFPDFSSVQCENEIRYSLFKLISFTFTYIPVPVTSILNAKITFLYEYPQH